jgi:hypothetical protein
METTYCMILLLALAYTCVILSNLDKVTIKVKSDKGNRKINV